MADRFVRLGGQRVRVTVRSGTGDGPPLVLCGGIGASYELLDPFVAALHPAVEVVRFDVPGSGLSPPPILPYGYPALAGLLRQLLAELGYRRADVLGISWGGGLAQQFALQYPQRCRRLVLVATGTGAVMVPARPAVLAQMLTPRRYRDRAYRAQVVPLLYGGSEDLDVVQRLFAEVHAGPRRGYVHQLLAVAGWTSLPFLPLIGQPALVLAGDDDPLIPLANAKILTGLLPRARLHVYSGGHLGLLTKAGELAPVVAEFLASCDGASRPAACPGRVTASGHGVVSQ